MTSNLTLGASVTARNFGWRHASRSAPALRGVDLDIAPGQRVLLTGDSGAGKSTLMAALAGVLGDADDGEQQGSLRIDARTVGLVLQDPDSQVISSRVGDDVAFGCENAGMERTEIWRRVAQALAMVGLDLPLDHPTAHLSGGQKQRLALAGVIAMGATLILLDEPTANLDPQGQREVVAAVDRVVAETGATLVVVEHRHDIWAPLVDRILRLSPEGMAEITAAQLPGPADLPPAQVAEGPALIAAHDLVTQFGPPRNLYLPQGASTVITGRNGAGKSTLALTLAGLLPPRSGTLELADQLRQGLKTPPHRWRSAALAQRIGTVFQDPEHQFVARTVAEEMAIGPKVMKLPERTAGKRIDELLERLRLTHLVRANPFTLSGGEKRRLSVATALVAAPTLLVLDEPTFGQDPATFRELVLMLRELTDNGVTVVSVTHDPGFIRSLGDHHVEVS